jgi:hypothetical protein
MRACLLFVFLWLGVVHAFAQTQGGNPVFSFLKNPASANIAALGGSNVSLIGNNVAAGFSNPSLLRPAHHGQVATSFASLLAGINQYSCMAGYTLGAQNVGLGVQYVNYGSIDQTDAAGVILGVYNPSDVAVQLSTSIPYKENFWLGATAKFIHSNYGQYRSSALAVDASITYFNEANGLQAGLVVSNIGTQLNAYAGAVKEELPFDITAGISKKLAEAPVQFSLTLQQLQRFNLLGSDTSFIISESGKYFSSFDKLMSHVVLGAQLSVNENIHCNIGYNVLRRQSLNGYNITNGLNGVTFGVGVLLDKLHINYATGFYQRNMFHQLSLNFNFVNKAL